MEVFSTKICEATESCNGRAGRYVCIAVRKSAVYALPHSHKSRYPHPTTVLFYICITCRAAAAAASASAWSISSTEAGTGAARRLSEKEVRAANCCDKEFM